MTPESDAALYRRQGFGASLGLHPPFALLIVDFVNGFADPGLFGGGNIGEAILATVPVLAHARAHGWPVAHSRIVYAADGADANLFSVKVPGLLALHESAAASAIVDMLRPAPGELVVRKTVPSAFFGTGLAAWLAQRGVRSLAIAGATTSGCVRASVTDAMSHGFRPLVLEDCVGDRAAGPHAANLFDMGQKNADIIASSRLLDESAVPARNVAMPLVQHANENAD